MPNSIPSPLSAEESDWLSEAIGSMNLDGGPSQLSFVRLSRSSKTAAKQIQRIDDKRLSVKKVGIDFRCIYAFSSWPGVPYVQSIHPPKWDGAGWHRTLKLAWARFRSFEVVIDVGECKLQSTPHSAANPHEPCIATKGRLLFEHLWTFRRAKCVVVKGVFPESWQARFWEQGWRVEKFEVGDRHRAVCVAKYI